MSSYYYFAQSLINLAPFIGAVISSKTGFVFSKDKEICIQYINGKPIAKFAYKKTNS